MKAVVLHRVGFLENFCPKQGQDFKPSAAPHTQTLVKYPPSPPGGKFSERKEHTLLLILGFHVTKSYSKIKVTIPSEV